MSAGSVSGGGSVGDDEVIRINIGGEKNIAVKKSLLTQVEGTFLYWVFRGRWQETLLADENGHVFLDDSPDVIMPLIKWLRARRDATTAQPAPPLKVHEPDDRQQLMKMMIRWAFPVKELKAAGFNVKELLDGGLASQPLKDGFTAKDFYDMTHMSSGGPELKDLRLKDFGFAAQELKDAGFPLKELLDAGMDAQQLKDAFTAKDFFCMTHMSQDGTEPATLLKNLALKDLGFDADELKKAGYGHNDLLLSGFTQQELEEVFSITRGRWSALGI
eukprot:gnl/TRDRNA2_/TRDRNA2_191482_c0_seq1.p1 gnl/TRDRNA2_/TRDRNA2_191482_c0~~gnl/TRDRNA2_/TRDRNA2_191482_c0_seq1.p1  ORF type:complete len:274 (+),score=75.79 gnl/TRDRNA2_/TRDRNA2_191482_c0_seq1:82-903(+)